MDHQAPRDLFLEFVPASVRPLAAPDALAVVSGSVLVEHATSLRGPVLESSWAGEHVARGVLRAARYADAILAMSFLPASEGASHKRELPQRLVKIAAEARFDRPLLVVARAPLLNDLDDGGIERMAEQVLADVQDGFTSIAFRPLDIQLDRGERMANAATTLVEMGISVELELDDADEGATLLEDLVERDLAVSAVRGASIPVPPGIFAIINPLTEEVPRGRPCRVILDGFVLKALLRALPAPEAEPLLRRATESVEDALGWAAGFVDELDAALQDRIEALTYVNVLAACRQLGATGTATDLLGALAAELVG